MIWMERCNGLAETRPINGLKDADWSSRSASIGDLVVSIDGVPEDWSTR
jgi:hypothetical protein